MSRDTVTSEKDSEALSLLIRFAIDIHESKPGEDDTPYFDQAVAAINRLVIEGQIKLLKDLYNDAMINDSDYEFYVYELTKALGENK